jgi:hypothetical protein
VYAVLESRAREQEDESIAETIQEDKQSSQFFLSSSNSSSNYNEADTLSSYITSNDYSNGLNGYKNNMQEFDLMDNSSNSSYLTGPKQAWNANQQDSGLFVSVNDDDDYGISSIKI